MDENPYRSPLAASYSPVHRRQQWFARAVGTLGGCLSSGLAYWLLPPPMEWWLLPIGIPVGVCCYFVFGVVTGSRGSK